MVILATLPKTRKRLFGTVDKRLSLVLIAISVLCQLNFALQLVTTMICKVKASSKVNNFLASSYFQTVGLLVLDQKYCGFLACTCGLLGFFLYWE